MANHEITEICLGCGEEYDVRLHHSICPNCQQPSMLFRPNKETHGRSAVFHINDAALIGAGFVREVAFDRDGEDFDNVKVVTFAKPIVENMKVEVTFGYRAQVENQFELTDSAIELLMGTDGVDLKITTLSELVRFTDVLIKSIKTRKYAARCS